MALLGNTNAIPPTPSIVNKMAQLVAESKDSFYVHLLSNVQPHMFKNKANHFKCRLETPLQFPSNEAWEVGLKEYHYVNNIDTITKNLEIEVGRLAPKRETWQSYIRTPVRVEHDTAKVDYPFYFTECGTQLTLYEPFHDLLLNEQEQQQRTNLMAAFLNFLQQKRLMSVLRVVTDRRSTCFQLKLRNTTNAIEELYSPSQYLLCMSHPLALVLHASTQCLRNMKEYFLQTNGMWTQNAYSWLGNDTHFKTFTLRTNATNHKKLAPIVVKTVNKWLNEHGWPKNASESIYREKLASIEHFLQNCRTALAADFSFTFLPLHRIKMQKLSLNTAELTYVELFRYLEEFGYGTLYITPDQSSLTFTMHDLSKSKLFAVELPTSLFAHRNEKTGNFFPPQVRVDKWKKMPLKPLEIYPRFTRDYDCPIWRMYFRTLALAMSMTVTSYQAAPP